MDEINLAYINKVRLTEKTKLVEKMFEILEETEEYALGFCNFHDSCEDCLVKKYKGNCTTYLKAQSLVNKNVVPVVHCCLCSHCTEVDRDKPFCTLHNMAVSPFDFCSYGERRSLNG